MAQSEDTPEGDGTSGTKPSFELFETTAGGRLLRGSDGEGALSQEPDRCGARRLCGLLRGTPHLKNESEFARTRSASERQDDGARERILYMRLRSKLAVR
jgi:hypothetical protein